MTGLPASVEAHLTEAGFAPTEIMALRKLLEGEALTLRELAAKTGKSTGVLDQAVKKLMSRGIVTRETFNDTPKYLVKSLDAVLQWMREDMEVKRKMLTRKERDFESFIASLKADQTRPEMEYFEGREGVEKAYRKLLESVKDKQLLRFYPVTCREEEDPLRDFRVQYFRERHKRSIFSRVIAQDTPLSRRYRSRDAFEYRETVLVPESEFPYDFEKIIAGDTVACFTVSEEKAYFIRSAALARSERELFEVTWRKAKAAAGAPVQPVSSVQQNASISLSAKTLSSVREFFLSRESVILFTACAVLAAGITFGLWRHNVWLNTERVRERSMAIAVTAATEFDARDIDQLHTKEDVKKPEFMKFVQQLQLIKSQNENVKFAYIDRPTGLKNPAWEVVADADFGDPDIDLNGNGVIEESEQLTMPGQKYPHEDPYLEERLIQPTSILIRDEWGEYYDSTAPIFDSQGKAVAVLFVDIDLQQVHDLTQQTFFPIYYFLGFFLLFVFIRLAAFNRPLFLDLLRILRSRETFMLLGTCTLLAAAITYGFYRHNYNLNLQRVREQVEAIAATAAPEFDADDLRELQGIEDARKPVYRKVVEQLQDIRRRNKEVRYAYILRPTEDPYFYQFVADADSLDIHADADLNEDGLRNDTVPPGYGFYDKDYPDSALVRGQRESTADEAPYEDPWGTWIAGHAPIAEGNGETVAVIGIDIDASEVSRLSSETFNPLLFFIGLFSSFVLMRFVAVHRPLLSEILRKMRLRRL
ncbi:TPA: hypothetical protein DCL30_05325 [Candidatus Peribacteria bacterium]|nr:MAG: hypothetical protein A3J91_05375 [Candidatus Peribacteria bacterium RIFOXYC2_FULL_58_10]OGJ84252.1 MAG: hypothetical protein A2529_00005 [Candidatus Peribacteria bacterium RIFOXYD2_FULL_58_15]HAI98918.1 hypothetical protein [Candidatus Peribacteria bacterium]HAS34722.1 hypothetical protein [Candidatus Peribacteria bacterium]